MAKRRIDMRKVRELLRLHYEQGISSARELAKLAGMGKSTASDYLAGFKSSGLEYRLIKDLSDSDLIAAIHSRKKTENPRYQTLYEQFPIYDKELQRKGVTLQLLWQEYNQKHTDCYGYSQFCHHYYNWRRESKVSMHMEHKAGDKLFVDYAGKKMSYTDASTGEIIECEVFVGVLGSSQLAYIEATPSQEKHNFISVNENALHFFGGAPRAIVPDCLKSAVTKADKYEPQVNPTYNDFACHYNTAILPARALKPQDKSLAENFVKHAYNSIYAPLRNDIFFSLEELNAALWAQLDIYNRKKFQKCDYSRQDLFDDVEKDALKPLTTSRYDLKTFCCLTVHYNHHIYLKEDKHYYSAPFQLTGKEVLVTYTSRNVEVYFNNRRVALHTRSSTKYRYTTKNEHRPSGHKFVAEWTPQRFINWAAKIGPEVQELVTALLNSRKRPEQAYKSCMGLLSLAKKHDTDDFIKACKKALILNCIQYKFVKNVLQNKAFDMTGEEQMELFRISEHKNLRGKEHFN